MRDTKQARLAAKKLMQKPKTKFEPIDLTLRDHPHWMTRAFNNTRYVVMINDNSPMTNNVVAIKAMIQRHDNEPIPNHWRELQDIKNELFGRHVTAIEFYPAESELMDVANIYWLWILPEGALPLAIL